MSWRAFKHASDIKGRAEMHCNWRERISCIVAEDDVQVTVAGQTMNKQDTNGLYLILYARYGNLIYHYMQ